MSEQEKIGIVLLNMGGPDSLDAVKPFLYNLFSDRDIIRLPGPYILQRLLASVISARRSGKSKKYYKAIGGKSPILEITSRLADKLSAFLTQHGIPAECFVAMRYWHPFAEDALQSVNARGIKRVVGFSLYPQYCSATSGSSIRDLKITTEKLQHDLVLSFIDKFYNYPDYIACLQSRIEDALESLPQEKKSQAHLVFSAHSVPKKLIKGGDPYFDHTRKTFDMVIERFRGFSCHLSFQSRSGSAKWLEPDTMTLLDNLVSSGEKTLIIVPISFVSDHVETLYEIDIQYRALVERQGGTLVRTESFNDADDFVVCLASIVREHLIST
ncbi:MAG: ferrochelatase [Pseudomonadota bacterium]